MPMPLPASTAVPQRAASYPLQFMSAARDNPQYLTPNARIAPPPMNYMSPYLFQPGYILWMLSNARRAHSKAL
jgi:hypothetical protein